MKTIKGANVFKSGTWNSSTFTDDDLDGIVKAFNEAKLSGRVPIKFGHNDEQPLTDGQPALGWVTKLWRAGANLMADFSGIPDTVYDLVKKGMYKFTSVELLKNAQYGDVTYPYCLDAVALLGAEPPAVNGLEDLQKLAAARKFPAMTFASRAMFSMAVPAGDDTPYKTQSVTVPLIVRNVTSDDLDRFASTQTPLPLKLGGGPVGSITALKRTKEGISATMELSDDLDVSLGTVNAIVDGANPPKLLGARFLFKQKVVARRAVSDSPSLTDLERKLREANEQIKALKAGSDKFARAQANALKLAHQREMIAAVESSVRKGKLLPAARLAIIRDFNLRDADACMNFSRDKLRTIEKLSDASKLSSWLRSSTSQSETDSQIERTPADIMMDRIRMVMSRDKIQSMPIAWGLAMKEFPNDFSDLLEPA